MDEAVELLRYEIKNVRPVTTEAYAQGLMAVADEFEEFIALHVAKNEKAAFRMNMASVSNGSLISDIAPFLAGTPPLLDVLKSVGDYATYLKALFDWMLSKGDRPEIADERKTLKNISNIVKPTIHDNGAQMNIGTISGGTFNINVSLSEPQARTILGLAKSRLDTISEVAQGVPHKGVLFYWDQANRKLNAKSGDKERVDDLADHAVNVRFADESLKQQMALDHENPFRKAYLVDLFTQTAHGGRIALYTISRLIDVIDIEPGAD
ncbi:hypothetical protein [Pseudomonas boanensis]|uniref:hypothetical protein n=1 Tax=Metapseudomonas boanensis TaxID=2822138 RepID=UPI0035D4F5E0